MIPAAVLPSLVSFVEPYLFWSSGVMKGEVNSVLFERVTAVLPMVPLLVVMSIAPLPAH